MIAAATEGLRGDVQFDATVLLDVRQFARQFPPIRPGLGRPTLQCPEQFLPAFVVHGTAVVRVHQAEVPQLGSLVGVGDARQGDFQQCLREPVEQPEMAHPLLERPQILQEWAAELLVQDAGDELSDGLIIGFVRVDPTGVDLGLVQRLDHVFLDSFHELGVLLGAARTEGPGAEECLVRRPAGINLPAAG